MALISAASFPASMMKKHPVIRDSENRLWRTRLRHQKTDEQPGGKFSWYVSLESGYLQLNLQYCDIEDLIGMVVHTMKNDWNHINYWSNHKENLPLIKADARLLNQALFNILHNAVTYSQLGPAIIIRLENEWEKINWLSRFPIRQGCPGTRTPKLFDKFYRIPVLSAEVWD